MPANHLLSRIFTVITAVIFVNISFFQAEVALLDIKDKATLENIAKLMLKGGVEEERDGKSSGQDSLEKEINLLAPQRFEHQLSLIQMAIRSYGNSSVSIADLHFLEVNSPPPKSHII